MPSEPRIVVIAGRNGAGKTTFAGEQLPAGGERIEFVNADLIAAAISPMSPASAAVRARRLMIEEIERHARAGRSFAFETTLAGLGWRRRIPRWRARAAAADLVDHPFGYRVELIFLSLKCPEEALRRVRQRVSQGRHDVAERIVRQRFDRGWRNFRSVYSGLVSVWQLVGSSGPAPVLIEWASNR